MAQIKVVGNPKPIYISNNLAEKILNSKNNTEDQGHLVDVSGLGFVEIGQIKQILMDDPNMLVEGEKEKERSEYREKVEQDYEKITALYKLQSPKDKALRTAKSYALLLWTSRGNWENPGDRILSDLEEKIVERLTPYFLLHPDEWSCGSKEYEDLIPVNRKGIHSRVKGVTSFADALISKE